MPIQYDVLKKQINDTMSHVTGTAKGLYKQVTVPLLAALKHCLDENDGGGKGDNSLVALIMKHLKDNESFMPSPLIKAVSDAAWQTAAIKMRYDSEKREVTAKKDGEQWDKIQGELSGAAMLKLENDGLIAFKPEQTGRKKPSKPSGGDNKVVDILYEQPAKEIIDTALKMKHDFPESSDLQWYKEQVDSLNKELKRRYEALCELRKASKNSLEKTVDNTPALDKTG